MGHFDQVRLLIRLVLNYAQVKAKWVLCSRVACFIIIYCAFS